ncbi:MAG: L,D-transpeptidase family protein [Acidobacteriaceae bacterium]|nr:L,D-transpeptidase family protein [Acidobacteriaceae bacterium]
MPTRPKRIDLWLLVLAIAAILIVWGMRPRITPIKGSMIADRVTVEKSNHRLVLYRDGAVLRSYAVALGRGGIGPKERAGDNRVPEGQYRIVSRNPHSAFYRALRVGYPTPQQVAAARAAGIDPGGDIMIHGIRNGLGWIGTFQRTVDWTRGCVAVTDEEMDEIWRLVPDGTPIEIRP